MPKPYQIIPQGSMFRPKIETHINDNTEVINENPSGGGTVTSGLFVFSSPRGRDGKILTITNGLSEFVNEYGMGPYSKYGQPLLNAYAAARAATSSNATLHCLRVTPDDAAYSNATLIAKYKVNGENLNVHFVVKGSDADLTDLSTLDSCCTVADDADEAGYTAVKLFTIAYSGKGEWGKNIRFRITNDAATDKNNNYKNYNFQIFRNESILEQIENHNVAFVPDAVYNGASIYTEDVLNDSVSGSDYTAIYVNEEGFKALYDAYKIAVPDTTFTINDFDALLGIDKYVRNNTIPNLVIESADTVTPAEGETAVNVNMDTGIALFGGYDGTIEEDSTDKDGKYVAGTLNQLYKKAFKGEIDENIKSKNRYPSTFIFDANFDVDTKLAIYELAKKRTDCMAVLDFGLNITTKASVGSYFDTNFDDLIDDRICTFEPYCMKVRDPYTQKAVTVTSTNWLASEYFIHINNWNGKHRPLAGNKFGIISGHINDSIYPVFDDDLDVDMLDELAEKHCNVAKYNQNQVVVRSMQNTAQSKMSALSEMNNVLILLDVKRDCEKICAMNEYDFSEAEDIARFNISMSSLADKYANAQVRSIGAYFDKNAWEAERGILHLYVEMVHKDLVKTTIIEIDVNRSASN